MSAARRLAIAMAVCCMIPGSSERARAGTLFEFSFEAIDDSGLSGGGTLRAVANGDGSFTATSGSGAISGYPFGAELMLLPNPMGSSGGAASPSGFFIYDDQLYPGREPSISYGGLVFSTEGGDEINLVRGDAGLYTLLDSVLNPLYGGPAISFSLSIAMVPEPSSIVMLSLGALPLAGYGLRHRRQIASRWGR